MADETEMDRLLATLAEKDRRIGELEAELIRVSELVSQEDEAAILDLLREFAALHSGHVRGEFTLHYPIDKTLHGNRCDEAEAWGCNVCGKGWPCIVTRTLAALDQGGTANG